MNTTVFPDKFDKLFQISFGLTSIELEYLKKHFKPKRLQRNEYLIKAGEVSKQKTYIHNGCTRTYQVDAKGNEHTILFSFEDYWIGDIESYYTGLPAKNNVQALEPCELLIIQKDHFSKLEEDIPKLKKWYTEKVLKHHLANLHQLTDTKLLSVEERYLKLLSKHPEIFQRVSQRHIANYLDIAPPSLSRLRARISKQCKSTLIY